MADTTTHLGIPKPNPDHVPPVNIDAEFRRLREAWDQVDLFLHELALLVAGKADDGHEHAMSAITGLVEALNAKMPADRQFKLDDLTDVSGADAAATNYVLVKASGGGWVPSTALAALGIHSHLISEVTGLAAALTARPDRDEVVAGLEALSDDLMAEIQARAVPVGTIIYFAVPTAPAGYLECDGAACSTLYPDLRALLIAAGSPFGTAGADPKLPDLRGEFMRGWDHGRGIDAGRTFGSGQLDQMQRITGSLQVAYGTVRNRAGALTQSAISDAPAQSWPAYPNNAAGDTVRFDSGDSPNARVSATTSGETRPRSIAMLPCIKAFGAVSVEGMAELAALLTAIASQAEAEGGTNNTKVMTPLRTRQACAAYNKWKTLAVLNSTSFTVFSLPDLGAIRILHMEGWFRSVSAAGYPVIGFSDDNGATWKTTLYELFHWAASEPNNTTAAYATAQNSIAFLGSGNTLTTAAPCPFKMSISELNKAAWTTVNSKGVIITGGGVPIESQVDGWHGSATAMNAFRFNCTQPMAAYVHIEGIEG